MTTRVSLQWRAFINEKHIGCQSHTTRQAFAGTSIRLKNWFQVRLWNASRSKCCPVRWHSQSAAFWWESLQFSKDSLFPLGSYWAALETPYESLNCLKSKSSLRLSRRFKIVESRVLNQELDQDAGSDTWRCSSLSQTLCPLIVTNAFDSCDWRSSYSSFDWLSHLPLQSLQCRRTALKQSKRKPYILSVDFNRFSSRFIRISAAKSSTQSIFIQKLSI